MTVLLFLELFKFLEMYVLLSCLTTCWMTVMTLIFTVLLNTEVLALPGLYLYRCRNLVHVNQLTKLIVLNSFGSVIYYPSSVI